LLAVGGEDGSIHLFKLPGLIPLHTYKVNRGAVSALAFSPDGSKLAVGDANRAVLVLSTSGGYEVLADTWVWHNARVTSVAWHAGGQHVVSGGLDTCVYVWSLERVSKKVAIKGAHLEGVNGVGWKGDTIVSVGQDGFVKVWEVELP
jgi:WD40 repeat protein